MPDEFDNLEEKIKSAKGETPDSPSKEESDNRGMRAGSEFLSAVIGFAVIGFGIDYYFGTKPWGMIGLMILGFVAGVYTASKTMNK